MKTIIFLIISGICLIFFQAYRDWCFICQNTGSQYGYREWFFGYKSNEWTKKSELENFISAHHKDLFKNEWVSYAGTGKNIFGISVSFGHGRPSNIAFMDINDLNDYVKSLNQNERLELYKIFIKHDRKLSDAEFNKYITKKLEILRSK